MGVWISPVGGQPGGTLNDVAKLATWVERLEPKVAVVTINGCSSI